MAEAALQGVQADSAVAAVPAEALAEVDAAADSAAAEHAEAALEAADAKPSGITD